MLIKYLTVSMVILALVNAAKESNKPKESSKPKEQQAPPKPKINWGNCPQLEPSEKDIESKSSILQQCLSQHPPPDAKSLTQEAIIDHQRNVTECALKIEHWFDNKGHYKFDKAKKEIKNKKLSKAMEKALMSSHDTCSQAAKDHASKAPVKITEVEKVQVYQGCMDAHITQHCQIQITA